MTTPLKYRPDPGHTFWLYSPEGDGLTFWKTAEERDDYAKKEIRTYLDDDRWFEEVEQVIAGVVTHVTRPSSITRPVGVIDENGYDEEDNGPWEDENDAKCDYTLQPIAESQS
jgi:hypothetical protein